MPKNCCFWTVVLEKTLESPLDCKELKQVNSKGKQSWIFTGSSDAEAEVPIFWPHYMKSWLFRKDPDAGKGWRQEEKGTTQDRMIGWHHWLNGHEFEQALGNGEGQENLTCCSPWGRRVGHDCVTEHQHQCLINKDANILNKIHILANQIQQNFKGSYSMIKWDLSKEYKCISTPPVKQWNTWH